ncbi:MAG TPA: hypothetical protein VG963_21780 [Polyangiaceae bacterium]|nr:hypothetical protein [Polyangiaceae bacterium]
MRPGFTRTNLICLALALADGCTGTDTGNPIEKGDNGGGTETGGAYCRAASTQTVALDAVTDLSFSANDVLAYAGGAHQETITWLPASLTSYGPESGAQSLSLSLVPAGNRARYVHYVPDTGGLDIGTNCRDALEVDMEVTLQSGQGALDEHFQAILSANSRELATLYHVLDPNKLGGSFAATPTQPNGFALTQLAVGMSFTRYGLSGSLQPTFERHEGGSGSDGSVSSAPSSPLATWGLPPCEDGGIAVPSDASVAGFSARDALALLAEHATAQGRWDDGAATSLSLSFSAASDDACAVLDATGVLTNNPVGTLRAYGTLTANSQDGHVAAHWPAVISARPDASGALEAIEIALDPNVQLPMGSLADQYGIEGFDTSGYDFFGVAVQLSLAQSGAWGGTVMITGYVRPNCSTTPTVDPNGGISSPGCPGSTPHALATLSLAP